MKGAKGAKAFESSSKTKPRVAEHSFAASDFSCFICSRIRLIYQRDKSSTTKFSSARAAATISYFSRFFVTVDKTSLHFTKIHLFITSFGLDLHLECLFRGKACRPTAGLSYKNTTEPHPRRIFP